MSKFTQPFRNLPAEIRLLIWGFSIPSKVTILGLDSLRFPVSKEPDFNLGLKPALQTQLLSVSRKVYDEVLPLLQRTEIHIEVIHGYTTDYARLKHAWQSPSFGVLHHHFQIHNWSPGLALHLLDLQKVSPPRSYHVSITADGKNVYFGRTTPHRSIYLLEPHYGVSVYAGVAISKGIVSEIQVCMENVVSSQMPLWDPEILQSYLVGSSNGESQAQLMDSNKNYSHHHRDFYDSMSSLLDLTPVSKIQITTEVMQAWQTDSEKFYKLLVKYSLADR